MLIDDLETLELRLLEQVFLAQYRPLMEKEDGSVRVILASKRVIGASPGGECQCPNSVVQRAANEVGLRPPRP